MLKKEDLRVGMKVKVSDIRGIPETRIYLRDFKVAPCGDGEGVVASFGDDAVMPSEENIFSYYLSYAEWLEEYSEVGV